MSKEQKEFETPETVNVTKLVEETAKKTAEAIAKQSTPAATPTALTEKLEEKKTFNYKGDVVKMLRSKNQEILSPDIREAIGAVDGASAVPQLWADDVFRCCPYPASAFWDAPYIKWHEEIHGKPGGTVTVVTVGRATCGTLGCEEPTSTAPVVGSTSITLAEYQCSMYICKDNLEDMIEDTVTELNNSLASCLDTCIDNAFIANLKDKGQGTVLKVGGTMTGAYIAEAIGSMRAGTCEPVALIIHPVVEASLMQDSQFVNAATFGDRSVITGGHIIKYLGLDIIVVPKGSLVYTTGTYDSILLARYAVHAAKKRDPSIESQYLVQTQRRYVVASVRFGKSLVCQAGMWHILTTK